MANKCEVCSKENGVEEVLDGSGMYHQLCEEHRHPKAPEEAPPQVEEEHPHGRVGDGERKYAALEQRVAQLEQLQQRDSEVSVKELQQLERRVLELEKAATAPAPTAAPEPPPPVPVPPSEGSSPA